MKKIAFGILIFLIASLSTSFAYETDDFIIDIPTEYLATSNSNSFTASNGSNINIIVNKRDNTSLYEEDVYGNNFLEESKQELLSSVNKIQESAKKNILESNPNLYTQKQLDDIIESIKIVDFPIFEVSTFSKNNYKCIHIMYSMNSIEKVLYNVQYIVVSTKGSYILTLSGPTKDYFESKELMDTIDSFTIKDYKPLPPKPNKIDTNYSSNSNSTSYNHSVSNEDSVVLTYHWSQYIDYYVIYFAMVLIAIILVYAIKTNGVNVNGLGVIIFVFLLQALAICGKTLQERIDDDYSIGFIAELFGFYFLVELAITILWSQCKKSYNNIGSRPKVHQNTDNRINMNRTESSVIQTNDIDISNDNNVEKHKNMDNSNFVTNEPTINKDVSVGVPVDSIQDNNRDTNSSHVDRELHTENDTLNNRTNHLNENRSKKKNITLIVIMFVVIIILLVLSIHYYNAYSNTQREVDGLNIEITSLKKQNSDYKKTNEELKERNSKIASENLSNYFKLNFYDKNIVFVIDGYGKYYYTYDQMKQVTQGIDEYTYWAYNKEQAIELGYKAWK